MRVNQPNSSPAQGGEVANTKKSGRAALAAQADKTAKAATAAAADGANPTISSKGKDLAKAKAVATDAPDVREEKIAELKRRIASGKYQVDTDAVASKMVDDHIAMQGMG